MSLLGTFAVTATVLVVGAPSGDPPVIASCPAPTVTFRPARVARGAELTITGKYFGDNCFDTGTVPPDVGPLGVPLTGLAIVIDQGSNEFVLATGSADSDYQFRVDVVIPSTLEPGEAVINILGSGDARLTIDPPLQISTAAPISADATVATFGLAPPPDTVPPGTDPPSVLPADIPDHDAVTTPPLSTAAVVDDSSTDDQQRAIAVGVAVAVAIGALGFALWTRSRRGR